MRDLSWSGDVSHSHNLDSCLREKEGCGNYLAFFSRYVCMYRLKRLTRFAYPLGIQLRKVELEFLRAHIQDYPGIAIARRDRIACPPHRRRRTKAAL